MLGPDVQCVVLFRTTSAGGEGDIAPACGASPPASLSVPKGAAAGSGKSTLSAVWPLSIARRNCSVVREPGNSSSKIKALGSEPRRFGFVPLRTPRKVSMLSEMERRARKGRLQAVALAVVCFLLLLAVAAWLVIV
jgi:hypothetical protein